MVAMIYISFSVIAGKGRLGLLIGSKLSATSSYGEAFFKVPGPDVRG